MGKSKSKVAEAVKAEAVSSLPPLPNGTEVTSLADFGYKVALYADVGVGFGEYAKANIPNFPDDVSDEDKAQVFAGFMHRKIDLLLAEPTSYVYLREGPGRWTPVDKSDKSADAVNAATLAMQYSAQAYGALRKSDPEQHRLLKPIRDSINKYCSNKWRYLVRLYSDAHKEARTRAANKTWAEYIDETLANIVKRHKTMLANSSVKGGTPDTTLPTKSKVEAAVKAFRAALA